MRDYIRNLTQRFDSAAHLARFVGVSTDTVKSWRLGRRQPSGPTLRLLEVLGVLAMEAPMLLAVVTKEEPKQAPKPGSGPYGGWVEVVRPLPKLEPLPVVESGPTSKEESQAHIEDKAYWLAQWEMTGTSAIDSLSESEYERIGRMIGKLD